MKNNIHLVHFKRSMYTLLLVGCFMLLSVYSTKKQNINVELSIHNSFTGSATVGPVEYISGSSFYTCTTSQDIIVEASTGSTWVIQGDVENLVAGNGIGSYTDTGTVLLENSSDGIKTIHTEFFQGNEVLVVPDLFIYLDMTDPTTSILISPTLNQQIYNTAVLFQWSSSSDGGAGIKEYDLVISTDPLFNTKNIYTTTQTSLSIDRNLLTYGDNYWYVDTHDNTCNTSKSLPSFFNLSRDEDPDDDDDDDDDDNGNNNNNNSSNKPPSTPNPEHDVAGLFYTPHTYYQQLQYTKDTFIPLTGIKAFFRNKNIDIVLASKKRQFEQEHFASIDNPYDEIVMPGYLQKTGANPYEIIRKIEILAQRVSLEQRIYLFNIIHQLLPNRTSGIILLLLILLYDVQTHHQWYYSILRKKSKKSRKKIALLTF